MCIKNVNFKTPPLQTGFRIFELARKGAEWKKNKEGKIGRPAGWPELCIHVGR